MNQVTDNSAKGHQSEVKEQAFKPTGVVVIDISVIVKSVLEKKIAKDKDGFEDFKFD